MTFQNFHPLIDIATLAEESDKLKELRGNLHADVNVIIAFDPWSLFTHLIDVLKLISEPENREYLKPYFTNKIVIIFILDDILKS